MKKFTTIVLFFSFIVSAFSQKLSSDTTYYSPGLIKTITYRIDKKKDRIVWYSADANSYQETRFLANSKDEEITYVEKGKLLSKYFKSKGNKNGTLENYFDSGKIKLRGFYNNDKEDSIWTTYSEEGNRIRATYYDNGKMFQDTFFYSDGKIKILTVFRQKNALTRIHFYKNGQVRYRADYKDSKMSGERNAFDESGKPVNGNFVFYHENGNKEMEGNCKDGKPEGEIRVYTYEGKLASVASFKNGLPEGYTYFYGNDGKPTLRQYYINGKFVKKGPQ